MTADDGRLFSRRRMDGNELKSPKLKVESADGFASRMKEGAFLVRSIPKRGPHLSTFELTGWSDSGSAWGAYRQKDVRIAGLSC
jgi:hypothetical protein